MSRRAETTPPIPTPSLSREGRKIAFTLAEVLITIGVIGVVAALTIPGLMTKIQEIQFRNAYKQAYSDIHQAFVYFKDEGLSLDPKSTTTISNGTNYSSDYGEIFKQLAVYFKSPKTCFTGSRTSCWQVAGAEQASPSSSQANGWIGGYTSASSSYAFMDLSGRAWTMYFNRENIILVDINGFGKPNKLGRDRFALEIDYDRFGDLTIRPKANVITKERWCPSGNCYYSRWLK